MILNEKFTELSTMFEKSLLKHDYVDSDDDIFDNLPFQRTPGCRTIASCGK